MPFLMEVPFPPPLDQKPRLARPENGSSRCGQPPPQSSPPSQFSLARIDEKKTVPYLHISKQVFPILFQHVLPFPPSKRHGKAPPHGHSNVPFPCSSICSTRDIRPADAACQTTFPRPKNLEAPYLMRTPISSSGTPKSKDSPKPSEIIPLRRELLKIF